MFIINISLKGLNVKVGLEITAVWIVLGQDFTESTLFLWLQKYIYVIKGDIELIVFIFCNKDLRLLRAGWIHFKIVIENTFFVFTFEFCGDNTT